MTILHPESKLADPPQRTASALVAELELRRREGRDGPGAHATARQHERGKLTAYERLALLFDDGVFTEIESLRRHRATGFGMEDHRPYYDDVVCSWGMVHGRRVFADAHDFRVFGGALGEAHAAKIRKVMDLAITAACPLVSLNDGEIAVMGAEGAADVIFRREIAASDDPAATREQKIKEYRTDLMHPYYAAERGLVDEVIDPRDTRAVVVDAFAVLRRKQVDAPIRKHGNPPC
jgi:acetyl-CoA carboxylase carboxyltransferase component